MRSSPSRRTRSGEPSGSGSSLESAAGTQYWRSRLPIGVPVPTRQSSSLSSRLSMASLPARHALIDDGVGDRFLQGLGRLPLAARADVAVAADLIDAPVDLDVVALGVAELDGQLAAGPAPSLEVDGNVVLAQPRAGAEDLVGRGHLEREVV